MLQQWCLWDNSNIIINNNNMLLLCLIGMCVCVCFNYFYRFFDHANDPRAATGNERVAPDTPTSNRSNTSGDHVNAIDESGMLFVC
jgi:hypothetical protein